MSIKKKFSEIPIGQSIRVDGELSISNQIKIGNNRYGTCNSEYREGIENIIYVC